jgi:hypothetical protein
MVSTAIERIEGAAMRTFFTAAFAALTVSAAAASIYTGDSFWPTETLTKADPKFPASLIAIWNEYPPEPFNTAAPFWCHAPQNNRPGISYCICHEGEGCAVLNESELCKAPMGTIANGKAAACRQREAAVRDAR